ncbi:hypothetical protein V8C44DRAFT_342353 [Trichoderma aethiopicum]
MRQAETLSAVSLFHLLLPTYLSGYERTVHNRNDEARFGLGVFSVRWFVRLVGEVNRRSKRPGSGMITTHGSTVFSTWSCLQCGVFSKIPGIA